MKACDVILKLNTLKSFYISTSNKFLGARNFTNASRIKANVTQPLKSDYIKKSIWDDLLPSILLPTEVNAERDWKEIRKKLLQAKHEITPIVIDSMILSYCINQKNYPLAYNYLEYLKSMNIKLNLASTGKCLRLFYLSHTDKMVTEKEEEDIFNMYEDIRRTYQVLDSSTCENVILAMSLTSLWQESIKLLEEIKVSCNPSAISYSAVIASAFKNNDHNLAWNLLEEMIDNHRIPLDFVYSSYFENCKASSTTTDNYIKKLEILFQFFRLNNIECSSEVVLKFMESCKDFNVSAHKTKVTKRGVCLNCKQTLQVFPLDKQDFEKLKQAIFENVIVGKNVFYKTTPDELDRFKQFLSKMKKYDVVIDGLNVAYSAGVRHSPRVLSNFVTAVVQHFSEQGKTILVLGRTHMQNLPNWKRVTNSADTFLTLSLSQDDPYLLYCALNSGLNTIIVSKDLMRSHLFKLKDPHLKIMFSQWLNQSQYLLQYVNNQGKVFFRHPLPFLRTTQNNNGHWHVPFNEDNEDKWLCVNG